MRIRSSQDLATGLLFLAVGLGAYWIGADYNMGTAQRPGTGLPASRLSQVVGRKVARRIDAGEILQLDMLM